MWGISIPINLFTVLLAIAAPFVFLMILVQQPGLVLILGAPVVALAAWRRSVRRRWAAEEAEAFDQYERHRAEIQADAIARRLQPQRPWE